jgi:hypothetical protein
MVDADATDIYVYLKRAVRNTIKKPAQCVMSNSRVPKELFAKKIREWVDQFAHTLQSTDIKEFIQELVIDPFMKYILQRTFPYMIIAFCLFGAVFLFVVLTFVLILFRRPDIMQCPTCKTLLRSGG